MKYALYFQSDNGLEPTNFKIATLNITDCSYSLTLDPIELTEALKSTNSVISQCLLREFKWYVMRMKIAEDLEFVKTLPRNITLMVDEDSLYQG